MFSYSFWADESYISGIAMQWVTGKTFLFSALNSPGIIYQRLQMLVIAIFFKLFGISEVSARLPSLIAFCFGIVVIFFLARKLSNVYGGLTSSFLYAFSHLNLAYAAQAKPYSALETITLLVIFLLVYLEKEKRGLYVILYNLLIIVFLAMATLLHSIGVLLWILYFVYVILTFKRLNILAFSTFAIAVIVGYIFILPIFINGGQLFPNDHLYQSTKLFNYKYIFISVCAFFGFIWIFKKYKTISIVLFFYSVVVFFMATFRAYIFNIRYVLSLFGILFLYFGIFWAEVGKKYTPKRRWLIPLIVVAALYITGYKIVRQPKAYYNPNIDKYGDIQIANYKDFYTLLKKRFPEYKKLFVINDTFDAEYWYFGRYSNAYFMKFITKPYKHHTVDAMVYGSLEDFKKIIKDHPQGFLIMEDWQSFLPDDIKIYAKKNLKLEFRVESLKEAPDDPWPLALYSWGFK